MSSRFERPFFRITDDESAAHDRHGQARAAERAENTLRHALCPGIRRAASPARCRDMSGVLVPTLGASCAQHTAPVWTRKRAAWGVMSLHSRAISSTESALRRGAAHERLSSPRRRSGRQDPYSLRPLGVRLRQPRAGKARSPHDLDSAGGKAPVPSPRKRPAAVAAALHPRCSAYQAKDLRAGFVEQPREARRRRGNRSRPSENIRRGARIVPARDLSGVPASERSATASSASCANRSVMIDAPCSSR